MDYYAWVDSLQPLQHGGHYHIKCPVANAGSDRVKPNTASMCQQHHKTWKGCKQQWHGGGYSGTTFQEPLCRIESAYFSSPVFLERLQGCRQSFPSIIGKFIGFPWQVYHNRTVLPLLPTVGCRCQPKWLTALLPTAYGIEAAMWHWIITN